MKISLVARRGKISFKYCKSVFYYKLANELYNEYLVGLKELIFLVDPKTW